MRNRLLLTAAVAALVFAAGSSAFAQGHIVIVNNNAPGVGFNDPTPVDPVGGNTGTTLGQQRLNVFQFAAEIWEAKLHPTTDILVSAQFVPLAANVLGSASATFAFRNFAGAELLDTWYPSALADRLAGTDLNPGFADINANFSTNFVFYLGFDNNEGLLVDLLPVVLHEIGHGLGFANFVNESTGTLLQGGADVYSQYTLDVTTNKIWNTMTDAERQASAINVRKVSWSGVNVKRDVPTVLDPGEPFVGVSSPPGLGPFMLGTASFGAPLTPAGVTGTVVLADDGVPPGADACTPLPTGSLAGSIGLVDRGVCTFAVKVKNAQDAGAIAVLVADNAPGAPPAGLGGADPAIVISSGRITLADGNTVKANLAAGVQVTLGLDMSILAGTDRVKKLMMVASLDPVAPGSSISHWEAVASPNQLMEPAINTDLTSSVEPPQDLTSSLMTDIGWFSDHDGVPDGADACIGSDTAPTVVIEKCNSKAGNDVLADGCSVSDNLQHCADTSSNFIKYLACVTKQTQQLRKSGVITLREEGAILVCAIKSLLH